MQQQQPDINLLPVEITSLVGGFIADELRAADPRCFRAARTLQAAWRHFREDVFDMQFHMSERCTTNIALEARVYGVTGGLTWTCVTCWTTGDHVEWDWEQDDIEHHQDWRF